MSDHILFYIILVFVIGAYILIGYAVVKILPKQTIQLHACTRLALNSFCYAAVFGIGIAASGGDPGIGFPLPVILAFFFTNTSIIHSVVIPMLFWWGIIFLIMFVIHLLKRKTEPEN